MCAHVYMHGPYCAGLQPDSCSHARTLSGVWGVAASLSFILCAIMNSPSYTCQMHGLIPLISIWHQAVIHYPFTTAINHTNMQGRSAQLSHVIKAHCWNTFSWVIPGSAAYSQHPQRIDPNHQAYSNYFKETVFSITSELPPLSLDSPSALHCCTLQQHILARDWKKSRHFRMPLWKFNWLQILRASDGLISETCLIWASLDSFH